MTGKRVVQVESVYVLNNYSEDQAMDYIAQVIGPDSTQMGKIIQV